MVPPEEIEELNAPTTLPADFGEWDSGEAPAKQPAKPATAHVAVLPVVERVPASVSRTSSAAYAEAEQVFQPPKPKADTYAETHKDESKGKKKKLLPLIGAGALTFVLVLGFMTYSKMRPGTPAPKPPVAQQPAAANTPQQAVTNTPASAPAPAPTPATSGDDRQRAQSEMMSHQLNAPSRIPSDLKMLAGKEPPPSSGFAASGMDGLGATQVLKADPATRHLTIIGLSAHAMKGDEGIALNAGCDGYLTKPIHTRTFTETIRRFIASASERQSTNSPLE